MLLTQGTPARQAGDVQGVALSRIFRGLALAERLEGVGRQFDSAEALATAATLRECIAPENIVIGRDLDDVKGQLFDSIISLHKCRSRFCPFCSELWPRRDQRRARSAISSVRLRSGERWHFVTLTGPTVENARLIETLVVFRHAWSLLRKRQAWRDSARGGVTSYEWTSGRIGFHTHVHLLVYGQLSCDSLCHEWTVCIEKAWRERGRNLQINTEDGNTKIEVKTISEEEVMRCANYLCKAVVWEAISDAHLIEIVEVRRWPRLFEVFGEARKRVLLVNRNLSDGNQAVLKARRKPRASQKLSEVIDAESWQRIVKENRERRMNYFTQRYPNATFETLETDETGGGPPFSPSAESGF